MDYVEIDENALDKPTPFKKGKAAAAAPIPPLGGGEPVLDTPQPAKERSFTDNLMRQIGMTVRHGVNATTGLFQGAADVPAHIANIGIQGLNKLAASGGNEPKLRNIPIPSETINQIMTQAGLPQPENPLEHVVGFGTTMLGGGMDNVSRGVQGLVNKVWNAPTTKEKFSSLQGAIKEIHEAGIPLPPSKVGGTVAARTLEGLGGVERTAAGLDLKAQPIYQNLARKYLRLPKDIDLTFDTLKANRDAWIEEGYKPLRELNVFSNITGEHGIGVGGAYRDALAKVKAKYGGSKSFPLTKDGNDVERLVNEHLLVPDPTRGGLPRPIRAFEPDDAMNRIRNLREQADANIRGPNPILGKAQREVANAIEDQIELFLSKAKDPKYHKIIENFKEARKQLAKSFDVEEALVDPNSGFIDPRKVSNMLANKRPITGELRTIGLAGSPTFGSKPPRGSVPPLNPGDTMMGRGVLAAAATQNPVIGAAVGGAPLIGGAARGIIGSAPYQRKIVENAIGGPGMFPEDMRARMLSSPFYMPLFSQGQE